MIQQARHETAATTFRRYLVKSPMQFRSEVQAIPEAPEKDYLVRVDVCGLCRSDLHFATSWAEDWDDLGHEFGGTIVAVGSGNRHFKIGERVAIRNASACLECPACLSEDFRCCTGLIANKLGFSQYADCDERSLVWAGNLSDDLLGMVEPTNVVLDLLHSAELHESSRTLVMGNGTLGLLAAYIATRHFGVRNLVVAGRRPEGGLLSDLDFAPYLSFDEVRATAPLRKVLGGAPDRVLVTTPPATLGLALEAVGGAGRVLSVGLDRTEALDAQIDVRSLIFKRARVEGVFAVPNLYFEEAVDVLGSLGKPLEGLVTRRVGFDDLESSLREWNERDRFDGKAILYLHGSPKERQEGNDLA